MSASLLLWQEMRALLGRGSRRKTPREDVPSALGRWGLHEFVEPRLRGLLAKHLGVGPEQLVAGASLRQDLAADSLDLVEVALLLEERFGVSLSDRLLDDVQSYGELVEVTIGLLMARAARDKRGEASLPSGPMRLRLPEERAAAPTRTETAA